MIIIHYLSLSVTILAQAVSMVAPGPFSACANLAAVVLAFACGFHLQAPAPAPAPPRSTALASQLERLEARVDALQARVPAPPTPAPAPAAPEPQEECSPCTVQRALYAVFGGELSWGLISLAGLLAAYLLGRWQPVGHDEARRRLQTYPSLTADGHR